MNLKINKSNYSVLAKIFHWGYVIFFAYGVAKQVDNLSQLEDSFFFRFEITFAIIFLTFLIIRFVYMTKTQKTSLPINTAKSQKIAAKIVHMGMYILLAGVAISGLTIGFLFWLGLKDDFFIEIVISIHEFIVNLLYWLIGIHILAASYHRLKKDGVWSSMVPFFKE
ncbi:cytochrome b/b6 domain-containing protein [Alphaproteobacteria bacterium]|nr:cytochrome b/b6 domain-containing protein [Alphaproteobacteria bacterium]